MALKQISVFVANETGSLGKLVNVLAEASVYEEILVNLVDRICLRTSV